MVIEKTYDDRDETGSVWNKRYVIRRSLGAGASAKVWLAFDKQTSTHVALKHFVQWKGNEHQCRKEIKNLEFLRRLDKDGEHVTKLYEIFYHEGRPCLAMEFVGGTTLKQAILTSKKKGVAIHIIRKAMQCLLHTFQFLASDDVDMLHGDLKPDNVILHDDQERVQLIDFGLASPTQKMQKNMYIQSRWYRSPEVLLGLPATAQVDMWSLGCLLVELFAGVPPFRGYDSYDQMLLIVDAIGLPSEKMRSRCEEITLKKLDELEAVVSHQWAKVDKEAARKGKAFETNEQRLKRRLLTHRSRRVGESETERELLVDLVCKLLVNDPLDRLTPSQALLHPFLTAPARTRSLPSPTPTSPQSASNLPRYLCNLSRDSPALSRLSSSSAESVDRSVTPESTAKSSTRLPQFSLPSAMLRLRSSKKEKRSSISAVRTPTPERTRSWA